MVSDSFFLSLWNKQTAVTITISARYEYQYNVLIFKILHFIIQIINKLNFPALAAREETAQEASGKAEGAARV